MKVFRDTLILLFSCFFLFSCEYETETSTSFIPNDGYKLLAGTVNAPLHVEEYGNEDGYAPKGTVLTIIIDLYDYDKTLTYTTTVGDNGVYSINLPVVEGNYKIKGSDFNAIQTYTYYYSDEVYERNCYFYMYEKTFNLSYDNVTYLNINYYYNIIQ